MTITTASALIAAAFAAGQIDSETVRHAQCAIRGNYYGNRMSGADRASMLAKRFGISA